MTRRLCIAGVAAALLFALPDWGVVGALRAGVLYGLVAYLPGRALWRALGTREVRGADGVLISCLLSVLPFTGLVVVGLSLGLTPPAAALSSLVLFALPGIRWGWGVSGVQKDRAVLAAAFGASLLLLALPFAFNGFRAPAWDAPMHAAIAQRILAGELPPGSPFVAGQSVNYYWFYHLYTASVSALTGLELYRVFALLNFHFLALFILAGYRLAGRLTSSSTGRLLGASLLVVGLNPCGWVWFALSANAQGIGDPWFSLAIPHQMVFGYPSQLASTIHEFLDGNPFPIAFPFLVLWLDVLARWLDGERERDLFGIGAVALASALYMHLLGSVLAVAAAGAAVAVVLLPRSSASIRSYVAIRALGSVALAGLLALAYAWSVVGDKVEAPLQFDFSGEFVTSQGIALAASVGGLLLLSLPAWRRRSEEPRSAALLFLGAYAAVLLVAALVIHVSGEAQYKLFYLASFALSALGARAWGRWRRKPATAALFLLAIAFAIPTTLITSSAFLWKPPREHRSQEEMALHRWIREQTPRDSIFVEAPYWLDRRTPFSVYYYEDRRWFDIPVYSARRRLVGYEDWVLEQQWGHRDVRVRRRLANKLSAGRPLLAEDRAYLESLDGPIYLVVHADGVEAGGFRSDIYGLVYDSNVARVYRLDP